ncbi:amine oxidase [Rhizoclosmatium globosum]|uniref:Amine oxidase n=1 Tax=Rhizoclosmatium globosum TaxID=329046 RepID=A0A1Y2CL14_9FUNG|nr:amine oxidase [Rhizoclosmatium globosum]|eukprot:ORY47647.1 amine oxidase [Rhizoclosmatium globosum]
MTTTKTIPSVIILGAGVSGIFAAKALKEAGINDVTVLEGRADVIGGRLHKAEFPPGSGRYVEIGGNWIEGLGNKGDENPVMPLAQKYNMVYTATDFTNTTYRGQDGSSDQTIFKERLEVFTNMFDSVCTIAEERTKKDLLDVSLRTAYRIAGWNPDNELDNSIEWNSFDYEQAETPDVSSFEYTADLKTFTNFGEDSDFIADQRGYQHIVEEEAKALGLGYGSDRLLLNKVVTEIVWAEGTSATDSAMSLQLDLPIEKQSRVTVKCKDGSSYTADYVICSFSLGVLQNHDVKFTPTLPSWKLQAINQFHMATYTKIFIAFPHKFWPDETEFIWYGADRRGEYSNWHNLEAKAYKPYFPHDHVLLCTVTDQVAFRIERQSDKATQKEMMAVLRNMYGQDIPEPIAILVPRWNHDPLFRGTFSN